LQQWVEAGGTLILSFRTGVKTGENAVADAPLPGALADLAGVEVTGYTALLRCDQGEPCSLADGLELTIGGTTHRLATDIWMDELAPRGATVLGRYHRGPYDGAPALTHHRVGNGHVLYVGTVLDATGHAVLTEYALALANIASAVRSPDRVEVVPRRHAGVTYWFVLNHTTAPCEITLPCGGEDLLTGHRVPATFDIAGFDALVVRVPRDTSA
jgi:beta-galactosidase